MSATAIPLDEPQSLADSKVNPRKGYWIEESDDGIDRFCFRARHDSKKRVIKLTQQEVNDAFNKKATTK